MQGHGIPVFTGERKEYVEPQKIYDLFSGMYQGSYGDICRYRGVSAEDNGIL